MPPRTDDEVIVQLFAATRRRSRVPLPFLWIVLSASTSSVAIVGASLVALPLRTQLNSEMPLWSTSFPLAVLLLLGCTTGFGLVAASLPSRMRASVSGAVVLLAATLLLIACALAVFNGAGGAAANSARGADYFVIFGGTVCLGAICGTVIGWLVSEQT